MSNPTAVVTPVTLSQVSTVTLFFIGLSAKENNANPFLVKEKVENLETNFRSYSEIINFNNSFFTHISKFLTNPNFSNLYVEGNCQKLNSKQGGYVQLSFVEKENDDDEKALVYAKKALEIIENLEDDISL